jgi:hypothetical protein
MRTTLLAQQCDVVVFGNSRGFSSDVFITDTARLLVIPSASELLNLYLDVDVLPDALVGPSEYAVNHDSITSMKGVVEALRSEYKDKYDHLKVPFSTVISPAVDCEKQFNPALYSMTSVLARGGCEDVSSLRGEASPCFSVGFVARLSPGEISYFVFNSMIESVSQRRVPVCSCWRPTSCFRCIPSRVSS